MYTVNGLARVAGLLALVGVAEMSQAQGITVRCGGDAGQTSATAHAGYHLNNNGDLVFNESSVVCGAVVGSPDVPNRLSVTFQVSAPVVNQAGTQATVDITGTAANFDIPASFFTDACTATINNPAGALVHTAPIQPTAPNGSFTRQVTFPLSGGGTYHANVACTRNFIHGAPQQAVVQNPASIPVAIDGGGVPTECPAIHNKLSPRVSFPFNSNHFSNGGGWGHEITSNTAGNRHWNFARNVSGSISPYPIDTVTLRYWSFVAPVNMSKRFNLTTAGTSPIAISISECPGDFAASLNTSGPTGKTCRAYGDLAWTTTASAQNPFNCHLEAGKTYYLNMSVFDINLLDSLGGYFSTAGCSGNNCVPVTNQSN